MNMCMCVHIKYICIHYYNYLIRRCKNLVWNNGFQPQSLCSPLAHLKHMENDMPGQHTWSGLA